MKVMIGRCITQKNDPLQHAPLSIVAAKLRNPKPAVKELISRLRTVRTLNPEEYRKLKKNLPYIVCASFKPPVRRNDNFAATELFILDIDHISDKGFELNALRQKLAADPRVVMLFASPGMDGLKLFFRLKDKCYDRGKYAVFYKLFAKAFAEKYKIEQIVDDRTSDVARACFISYDPDIYFNPEAQPVVMDDFVDFDNPFDVGNLDEKDIPRSDEKKPSNGKEKEEKSGLPEEIWDKIKGVLGTKTKRTKKKPAFVPEELNQVQDQIIKAANSYGIKLKDVRDIQYGKQYTFAYSPAVWAEINVYFGKKGFSIVKSTKSGSNQELAEAMKIIIENVLFSLPDKIRPNE